MDTLTIAGTDLDTLFASQQRRALRLKKSSAADRIARLVNLKTVIADHVDEILEALHSDYKPEGPGIESPAYPRMVNAYHFHRVRNLLEDAIGNGANLVTGGQTDESDNYIAPTLLSNVKPGYAVMKEEIFGPVLPVMTYHSLNDAVDYVNQGERPLALYVFGKDTAATEFIINSTTAGGTVVNHVIMHYMSPFLPFGGVGNSGVGRGHGHFGFMDFSNQRPVIEM